MIKPLVYKTQGELAFLPLAICAYYFILALQFAILNEMSSQQEVKYFFLALKRAN